MDLSSLVMTEFLRTLWQLGETLSPHPWKNLAALSHPMSCQQNKYDGFKLFNITGTMWELSFVFCNKTNNNKKLIVMM